MLLVQDNEEVENTRKYLETNYTDVNMSALTDLLVKDWHCGVSPDSIITTEVMIKEFDLKTESAKEIDFEAEFCLHATLPGFSPFNVSLNLLRNYNVKLSPKRSTQ